MPIPKNLPSSLPTESWRVGEDGEKWKWVAEHSVRQRSRFKKSDGAIGRENADMSNVKQSKNLCRQK